MDGAREDLQDMFIVHTMEEIEVICLREIFQNTPSLIFNEILEPESGSPSVQRHAGRGGQGIQFNHWH